MIHTITQLPPLNFTTSTTSRPSNEDSLPTVRHRETNTKIYFQPGVSEFNAENTTGELLVAENELIWWNESQGKGITIAYPSIIIHAVSTNGDRIVQHPHIYLQLKMDNNEEVAGENENDEDIADDGGFDRMRECRLEPETASSLDQIFLALSECAALHPDQDQLNEQSEEEENEWFTSADDAEISEAAQAALAHLENVFDGIDASKFSGLLGNNHANDEDSDDKEKVEKPLR